MSELLTVSAGQLTELIATPASHRNRSKNWAYPSDAESEALIEAFSESASETEPFSFRSESSPRLVIVQCVNPLLSSFAAASVQGSD